MNDWTLANIIRAAENPEFELKLKAAEEAMKSKPEEPKKEETWRDRAIADPTFTRPFR